MVSREQFMWSLSNGVIFLSVAAAFWMALAAWKLGLSVLLIAAAPILLLSSLLLRRGLRIRSLAPGFSRESLRNAPKGSSIRRMGIGFNIVGTAQAVSIGLVGFVCWKLNLPDLIWPLIGLVISLHFLALGWVFSVRPYYVLGAVGVAIALIALLGFSGSTRTVVAGLGLGLVCGGCAAYLIANAGPLADAALRNNSLSHQGRGEGRGV
jgi:hypothetical protein